MVHTLRGNRFLRVLLPDNLLAALRLAWVLLVIWGEIGVFVYALLVCRWPKLTQNMVRLRRAPRLLFDRDLFISHSQNRGHAQHVSFSWQMRNYPCHWLTLRHLRPYLTTFTRAEPGQSRVICILTWSSS